MRLVHSLQVWRFPFFDDVCKWRLDFLSALNGNQPSSARIACSLNSVEPQIREAPITPIKAEAQSLRRKSEPAISSRPNPSNIRPPVQAKITFAPDDPDETETDDEEGGDTEDETEEVHRDE